MSGGVESILPNWSESAIECRGVCMSYGKLNVLNSLALTVQPGHIYGLLGPSGCGKTTLLRCIVGRLRISKGRITVLGKPPAFPGHGVPGRMVGYMPQDLALYDEFTISDTFWFFGRIHGLTSKETESRISFLIEFLDLPEKSRLVRNLSGGQRRRVSLGAALLQNPQLLILDEPTVGVDPVLRSRIWQHLLEIVKNGQVSIVITTHYIEEARQANVVGLMRNGILLAEAPPEKLMQQHGALTLESAFLELCQSSDQSASQLHMNPEEAEEELHQHCENYDESFLILSGSVNQEVMEEPKLRVDWNVWGKHIFPKWRNIVALMIKTIVRMKRMPGSLCFQFLLPVIQVSLMCLCIGGEPKEIQMAVVNNETEGLFFSQSLLWHLDNSSVHQVFVNQSKAIAGVKDGQYWGIIGFGANFSNDLLLRIMEKQVTKQIVDGGSVHIWLDMTNQQIAFTLQLKLQEAFEGFVKDVFGKQSYLASLPLKFEVPVYGSKNPDFTTFIAPGAIVSITFFLAVGLTALSFVMERKQGLLDRCWVAGVSSLETMLAHLFSQLFTIAVQITLLLIFVFLVFKIPNEGSLVLIAILIFLQGVTGISMGLVLSSAIDDEQSANQASLGIFFPNLIISGIIWPIECIPYPLRYLSMALPQTYAAESLRCIMSRGWGLTHVMVWRGFAITLAWSTFFLILATVILKIRR
ncbi:ABC transporter G family member 20 isoform X1 [Polyodon spathula]|uniref:ABC transporter G family member 20 isoform X1 n=1 Tax=Polyodon spathula TaxID=7913 RepID=UPI001B7E3B8E|nr:ABC transporter G family member 20 isoform X1 [Polyodon spathula]